MDASQHSHVGLFNAILDFDPGSDIFQELLSPWIEEEREWVTAFAQRVSPDPIAIEDSWRLYALSRINQLLLMAFQTGTYDGWEGPKLSLQNYLAFMTGMGFTTADEAAYSPFFHEIVQIVDSDVARTRKERVKLARVDWPALMLGSMMFSRAGVAVSCLPGALRPEIATSSRLYWAYRRKYRLASDLSHGWGSNSQWRTQFRRDFIVEDELLFNADGKHDLATTQLPAGDDDLTTAERIELLTNRCFINCAKPDEDLFPYEDCIRVPRGYG